MLLFLHGFLGQKEDWDPLIKELASPFPIQRVSLPGHGNAPITNDIALSIQKQVPTAKWIVGYSAGGRIALELKSRFPNQYGQAIILSAHPGLHSDKEREERYKIDQEWIRILRESPFEKFLEKWYSQDLFLNLKTQENFKELLKERKKENPFYLADFLERYSLAKTPLPKIDPNTIFIYGKQDLKYRNLYRTLSGIERIFPIENATHAVHIENPKACAKIIQGVMDDYYGANQKPTKI